MKKLFQISLLFLFAASVFAQESLVPKEKVLRVYDWKDLNVQSTNCQIISMDGMSVLKIENTDGQPFEISLLKITNSSLLQRANRIEWEMKYENVRALIRHVFGKFGAHWRTFEKFPPQVIGGDNITNDDGFYFDGTRNWDINIIPIIQAPYDRQTPPNELEFKFSMPTNGTVYIRPIKLLGVAGSWWSDKQSGIVGGAAGIFGGIIGCFGGLLGCLAGFGKARKFVLTTTKIFIALGMLLTIAGIVAIACGQPFFVWYVFLLPGVMLTLIFSLNFPLIQRRYDDLEIRRMASIDAMGS